MPTDRETGLIYARNRYYDPKLGRFISADPLGYVDGPSMYAFGGNNPVDRSDPMGLCQTCAADAIVEIQQFEEWVATLPPEQQEAVREAQRQAEIQSLDFGVGITPYLGELHDFSQAATGRNWITQEELSDRNRAIAFGALFAPIVSAKIARWGVDLAGKTRAGQWAFAKLDEAISFVGNKWTDFKLRIDPSSVDQFATYADEAFFWSGSTGGVGGGRVAEEIASRRGGKTLDMVRAERGIPLPPWNGSDPAAVEAWKAASKAYAENASGTVRVVLGKDVNPESIWTQIELPALKANKRVDKIIAIDPATGKEQVIYEAK